ncbi:MAG: pirin family protein [Eubacteriaceae bacterium]|nr:pirin family protein [Eubacteriaceae bacterium]
MKEARQIKEIIHGSAGRDGAGVNLQRVFSHSKTKELDPFLMLDAFDSKNPDDYTKGFPWHPHRGIETVTYLISGKIEHGDSMGNTGTIDEGCCQWMSAGSGIIHQEMPKASDHMLGVQLWVNLPAKLKMSDPAYRDIRKKDVVVVKEDNATVKIIAGEYKGSSGPVTGIAVGPTFLDIEVDPESEFVLDTRSSDTLFTYIMYGKGKFCGNDEEYGKGSGILYTEGDFIKIATGMESIRVLAFSGQKLNEPIAWSGPIVMNTQEELDLAFKELGEGTFIKHKQ